MEREENYYEILGVTQSASADEIRKSYKALAMKYHPDRLNGLDAQEQERLTEKMKKITNAYTTLKDDQARKEYDQRLFMQQQYGSSQSGDPFRQYARPRYTYTYRSYRPRTPAGGLLSTLIFFAVIAGVLLLTLTILSVVWPFILIFIIISLIFRRR